MKEKPRSVPPCPNQDNHTVHPTGYVQHANWAEEVMKTHVQKQCPKCGLWVIWEKKK